VLHHPRNVTTCHVKKYFSRVASLFHESLNLFIVPIGFKLPNGLDASWTWRFNSWWTPLAPDCAMGSQGSHVLFGFSLVKWTERIIANHVNLLRFSLRSHSWIWQLCSSFFNRGWMVRDNLSFLFFSSTMNPSWNVTDCRIGGLSVYAMKASPTNNTFIVPIGFELAN